MQQVESSIIPDRLDCCGTGMVTRYTVTGVLHVVCRIHKGAPMSSPGSLDACGDANTVVLVIITLTHLRS
jgi:hypothetical protein